MTDKKDEKANSHMIYSRTPEGFIDVNGIVSRNILLGKQRPGFDLLNTPTGSPCHVAGHWPGWVPR
jgi:hypothetical protein